MMQMQSACKDGLSIRLIGIRAVRITALFLVVFLVLAACTTKPKRAVTPAKPPTGLVPPGTEIETIPSFPGSSLKNRILAIANNEWFYFGQQKVVYGEEEESIPHVGYWEDEGYAHMHRVNLYWQAVKMPELSGADCNQAWSAAFISWVMRVAGVPEELFPPAKAHGIYLSQIIASDQSPDTIFYPRTIREYKPKPGDLICASRESTITPDINEVPRAQWFENAKLHCDIVVERNGETLSAIGGNVRNSVSKSILKLTPEGYLQPTRSRRWFLIVENRLE
jgi:hypothetical protein